MATKDLSYFVKREHKNTDKVNKRIANKSKEIEKILKQQEKVILDRIDKFYQDFGDTYGVSEEQAKKLVSQFDVDAFKERARKYVETKDTSHTANYDMRLYDTKQRVSRLKLLLNEINLDIAEGYQKTSLVMNDILTTGQMKEMERQANLFKLPKNQVKTATEALLRETYTGAKFSSYWGKDLTNLYDILDVAIKGVVFNGQHPFKLKSQINKEFNTKDKWSKRLLITEATRIQSMVQIAAMKEAGFEYFRFIAEKSACDECGSYNNKVYSLAKWEQLVMIPPVHPHCRCSLVPATKEEYFEDKAKILLNQANESEPQITADLKVISQNIGSKLEGLDFRLKTLDSLNRKVSNEPNSKMRDVVRYTSVSTPENMTRDINKFVDELKGKGYNISAMKNYWNNSSNPYNGVNANFYSPNNYEFELQFHTKESFDLKNGKLHELYEKQRVLDPMRDFEEINKLTKEMFELSAGLSVPKNIKKIGGAK